MTFYSGITFTEDGNAETVSATDGLTTVEFFAVEWPPQFAFVVEGKPDHQDLVNWDSAREYAVQLIRERARKL